MSYNLVLLILFSISTSCKDSISTATKSSIYTFLFIPADPTDNLFWSCSPVREGVYIILLSVVCLKPKTHKQMKGDRDDEQYHNHHSRPSSSCFS